MVKMGAASMTLCLLFIALALVAMADFGSKDSSFNLKKYGDNQAAAYSSKKNAVGSDANSKFLQGSLKNAAAKKKYNEALAKKQHDKRLEKENKDKASKKKAYDHAAASASFRNKIKNAAAAKKNSKKYNRAKNVNIYSKKASDITNSYENNAASAKSQSKDSASKKAAAKKKGLDQASKEKENEVKGKDQASSQSASKDKFNAAHVKTGALKKAQKGNKKNLSSANKAYHKKAKPFSYKKSSFQKSGRKIDLGSHGYTGVGSVGSASLGSASYQMPSVGASYQVPSAGSASYRYATAATPSIAIGKPTYKTADVDLDTSLDSNIGSYDFSFTSAY